MDLTPRMIARAMALRPGDSGRRLVLDPRGIHHHIIPSKNFAHSVANHAEQKNLSVAESLYIVERLTDLGAVGRQTVVRGQGAVMQAFHGAGGREAYHTRPCQLVLDNQFPHKLRDSSGRMFNTTFLHRTIQLFARCTWQPAVVNAIDQVLDWAPEADFVSLFLGSVNAVLAGTDAYDAYREFTWRKEHILHNILEQVQDEPLTLYDAMLLMGALTAPSGSDTAMTPQELERLLADKDVLSNLQQQREIIINVGDHRAESVSCQLSQRSHHPDAFSPHQWVLTSRIGTPFALLQLLVFLPQEPFMHARTQRRFEDRDSQRAFALLDGPIGQDDNPFPLPCAHVPG
jgi:hypothetical protein